MFESVPWGGEQHGNGVGLQWAGCQARGYGAINARAMSPTITGTERTAIYTVGTVQHYTMDPIIVKVTAKGQLAHREICTTTFV